MTDVTDRDLAEAEYMIAVWDFIAGFADEVPEHEFSAEEADAMNSEVLLLAVA